MNMKPSILLIALALLAGCSTRTAQTPDGRVLYKSTRFGNKESIRRVEYRAPDGSVFILEGFAGDQVEGLGIVTEAAARGAVQGLTGQAGGLAKPATIPEGMKVVPKDDPSKPQPEIQGFGQFVPPQSGGFITVPNFPFPGQPVLQWDGKNITTNVYRPNMEVNP